MAGPQFAEAARPRDGGAPDGAGRDRGAHRQAAGRVQSHQGLGPLTAHRVTVMAVATIVDGDRALDDQGR